MLNYLTELVIELNEYFIEIENHSFGFYPFSLDIAGADEFEIKFLGIFKVFDSVEKYPDYRPSLTGNLDEKDKAVIKEFIIDSIMEKVCALNAGIETMIDNCFGRKKDD